MTEFDQVISRKNTASEKWDLTETLFGEKELLPLWVADMDFTAPPEVVQAITERAAYGIYGYTSRPASYYEAIIAWQRRRHQWEIEQEWLTFAPGVVPALSMLVASLTQPQDRVVIQPPVYPPFFAVIQDQQRVVVENPLLLRDGRYEMDFAHLEETFQAGAKMMILCSPHNPVGRVWTREELSRLAALCLRYGVILVSDEIHCDLVYSGHKHIPIASLSKEIAKQSITCISVGKSFNLAGLQTASVIIPNPRLRQAYNRTLEILHLSSENYFGAIAVEAAYTYGEKWLEELLRYLEGNIEKTIVFLTAHLPQIKAARPEGTYLLWLDVSELGMNSEEIKRWMYQKAKVALNEGSTFGKQGEGYLRLNLACPRATLSEGLHRIEHALKG